MTKIKDTKIYFIRKCSNFCDMQHFKMIICIMTDNIVPEHIRCLRISYNFWNVYHFIYIYIYIYTHTHTQIQHKQCKQVLVLLLI